MKNRLETLSKPDRSSERGGAGIKFLLVMVVLFLIGHAGYNYVPTAYQSEDYKQRMNETVVNAFAMPNAVTSSPEAVKLRLRTLGNQYDVPQNALIKVDKVENGAMKARVFYTRQIEMLPLGLYSYTYEFDHTATPNGFLTK
jgi:hypothetical protein